MNTLRGMPSDKAEMEAKHDVLMEQGYVLTAQVPYTFIPRERAEEFAGAGDVYVVHGEDGFKVYWRKR
ncbi:MAG: hypothetical protein IJV67_02470 [Clostridia bacterium]|nr:hypothetical protein [Clostridia bacterium]